MSRPSKLTEELQSAIVGHLEKGVPDETACEYVGIAKSTFYNWLRWGRGFMAGGEPGGTISVDEQDISLPRNGKKKFMDFLDAVTRARGTARVHAIDTLHEAIGGLETVTEIVESIEETRLTKDGKPYTYTRKVNKTITVEQPPDWRAAIEYLERRDPENWGKRQKMDIDGTLRLSEDVIRVLKQHDVDTSEVVRAFEDMVRAAAAANKSAD